LLGQQSVDQIIKGDWYAGLEVADTRRDRVEGLHRGRHICRARERRTTGQHLKENNAKGVEVGAGVRLGPFDLLRTQVLRSAQHGARSRQVGAQSFGRLGDPKVGDLGSRDLAHLAVLKKHVGGFDVSMNESGRMGMCERIGDLEADSTSKGKRQGAVLPEVLTQGPAAHQFHHNECGPGPGHPGVVGGHDVGMRQSGRGYRLLPKPFQEGLVRGQVGVQNLDRDRSGQDLIMAFPNGGHAALGEKAHKPIPAAAEFAVRAER
jgi:hypothetical protein